MALSDAKKSLVAAKAAIDAKNWADVLQHTEQAMGLNEVDPDEFSPLRQALSADPSTLAKDVVPLLYQALVFRGMACYNEAKQSATASSTTSTSKSESGLDADAEKRYDEAQVCYLRAISVQPSSPLAWQGMAELINYLIFVNASRKPKAAVQSTSARIRIGVPSSAAPASSSSPAPAELHPLQFDTNTFESYHPAMTRPPTSPAQLKRHVQLNSALAIVYRMLAKLSAKSLETPEVDKVKALDRATKYFGQRVRHMVALEEAQLIGLAHSAARALLGDLDTLPALLPLKESASTPSNIAASARQEALNPIQDFHAKFARITERLIRLQVNFSALHTTLNADAGTSPGVSAAEDASRLPLLQVAVCSQLGVLLKPLCQCLVLSFVAESTLTLSPAPTASTTSDSKTGTASASAASSSGAKASSSAKATSSTASAKATTSAKATAAPAAKAVAAVAPSAPPSPLHLTLPASTALANTTLTSLFSSDPDATLAQPVKGKAPTPTVEPASLPALDALLASFLHSSSFLASPNAAVTPLSALSSRQFLQGLIWSSFQPTGSMQDVAYILTSCLRLTGILTPLLSAKALSATAPTSQVYLELTGSSASASDEQKPTLRQIFGSPFSSNLWSLSTPTSVSSYGPGAASATSGATSIIPYAPTSQTWTSSFKAAPTTLAFVPLTPQYHQSGVHLQSTSPFSAAAALPLLTLLRYHVRGYGYDGLAYFEENAVESVLRTKQAARKSPFASYIIPALVALSRPSVEDIRAEMAHSDEESGFHFQSSVSRGSNLHSVLLTCLQRFPSDSLSYLLFLESTFDSWFNLPLPKSASETAEGHGPSRTRDIIRIKIESILSQASAQMQNILSIRSLVNNLAQSQTNKKSAWPSADLQTVGALLQSLLVELTDIRVVAIRLLASLLVCQQEYHIAVTTCRSGLAFIQQVATLSAAESASASTSSSPSSPPYTYYRIQLQLMLAKSLARVKRYQEVETLFKEVLAQEAWNPTALLGLASILSADSSHSASNLTLPFYDLALAHSHLKSLLQYFPEHQWAQARVAFLESLPYSTFVEHREKESIVATLSSNIPSGDAVSVARKSRQSLWLGLEISGVGEGLETVTEQKGSSGKDDDQRYLHAISVFKNYLVEKSGGTASDEAVQQLMMRKAIQSRDTLKELLQSRHASLYSTWNWAHYWLARLELVLGNDVDAKEHFEAAAPVLPLASAYLGHLAAKSYVSYGTELDLQKAINFFSGAMSTYADYRKSDRFIPGQGRGDGTILLEAGLPLLHIFLEKAFDKSTAVTQETSDTSLNAATTSVLSDIDSSASHDVAAIPNEYFQMSMSLLHTISSAGHKWAAFKAATYQLRQNQLDAALTSLLSVLRAFPRHVDANILLVEIYRRQGKMAAAIKVCNKLVEDEANSLLAAGSGSASSPSAALLFFLSSLIHFKANLISTAIQHANQCLRSLRSSSISQTALPFIELTASYMLCKMLFAESLRLFKEGRDADAALSLKAASEAASLLSADKTSSSRLSISKYSVQKLLGDVFSLKASRLVAAQGDQTATATYIADSLFAEKNYSFALLDVTGDVEATALLHMDLANLHFNMAFRMMHDERTLPSEAMTLLKALDKSVAAAKQALLSLVPSDADSTTSEMSSTQRVLALKAWRWMCSVSIFYRKAREHKIVVGAQLKWNTDLGLAHFPSSPQIINAMYLKGLHWLVELDADQVTSSDMSAEEARQLNEALRLSLGEFGRPSQLLARSTSENRECARLWAEAGIYWLWNGVAEEVVRQALKSSKSYDASLLTGWTLHALLLLHQLASMEDNDKSGKPSSNKPQVPQTSWYKSASGAAKSEADVIISQFEHQSIHSVMSGLLIALETEESDAAVPNGGGIDASYSLLQSVDSDQRLTLIDPSLAYAVSSSSSLTPSEIGANSVALVVLALFAIRGLDPCSLISESTHTLSIHASGASSNQTNGTTDTETVATSSAAQLIPALAFARRVSALSHRFVLHSPWNGIMTHLDNMLRHTLGYQTSPTAAATPQITSAKSVQSASLLLNASALSLTEALEWAKKDYMLQSGPVTGTSTTATSANTKMLLSSLSRVGLLNSAMHSSPFANSLVSLFNQVTAASALCSQDPTDEKLLVAISHRLSELSSSLTLVIQQHLKQNPNSSWIPLAKTLIVLVLSTVATVLSAAQKRVPSSSAVEMLSLSQQLTQLVEHLESGLEVLSTQVVEEAETHQLLVTYGKWISTFLKSLVLWRLEEHVPRTSTATVPSKSLALLDSLWTELLKNEYTSEAMDESRNSKRRITLYPIAHGASGYVLLGATAPSVTSTLSSEASSMTGGLALPLWSEFVSLLSLLHATILSHYGDSKAVQVWLGHWVTGDSAPASNTATSGASAKPLPSPLLPTSAPVIAAPIRDFIDEYPHELVSALRPTAAESLNLALWWKFASFRLALLSAVDTATLQSLSQDTLKWMKSNTSEDSGPAASTVKISSTASSSSAPSLASSSSSITSASSVTTTVSKASTSSSSELVVSPLEGSRQALYTAQRAVMMEPWRASSWQGVTHTYAASSSLESSSTSETSHVLHFQAIEALSRVLSTGKEAKLAPAISLSVPVTASDKDILQDISNCLSSAISEVSFAAESSQPTNGVLIKAFSSAISKSAAHLARFSSATPTAAGLLALQFALEPLLCLAHFLSHFRYFEAADATLKRALSISASWSANLVNMPPALSDITRSISFLHAKALIALRQWKPATQTLSKLRNTSEDAGQAVKTSTSLSATPSLDIYVSLLLSFACAAQNKPVRTQEEIQAAQKAMAALKLSLPLSMLSGGSA